MNEALRVRSRKSKVCLTDARGARKKRKDRTHTRTKKQIFIIQQAKTKTKTICERSERSEENEQKLLEWVTSRAKYG